MMFPQVNFIIKNPPRPIRFSISKQILTEECKACAKQVQKKKSKNPHKGFLVDTTFQMVDWQTVRESTPKKEKKTESLLFVFWQIINGQAHWSCAYPRVFADASCNIITCVCFGKWIFVHGSCNYLRIRIQEDLVGIIQLFSDPSHWKLMLGSMMTD